MVVFHFGAKETFLLFFKFEMEATSSSEKKTKKKLSGKEIRRQRLESLGSEGIPLVLDFSFHHLMADAERRSLKNQVKAVYGANLASRCPLRLSFAGVAGAAAADLDSIGGFQNWLVETSVLHFSAMVPLGEITYLSPDSPNVLQDVRRDRIYVVACLVDLVDCPGTSLKAAQDWGLETARLPLQEYVTVKPSNRLPLNHVCDILRLVGAEGLSWEEAFLRVLPDCKVLPKVI